MNRIDGQQIRSLVVRYGAALTLYARQWCRWPDDAVQEALLELIQLPTAPREPAGWLFRTVKCRAMNQSRSERRRADYHDRWSSERDAWFVDDNGAIEAEEAERMLEQLDELDREIVVARVWGELSFEQIAELVAGSTSSVHRRYGKALERLATLMEGESRKMSPSHE